MTRAKARMKARPARGSRVGDDLVEAFCRKVASSTKEFGRLFGVSARTMETYEQGRRRPSRMALALSHIIDREPEAARRALAGCATARAA